MFITALRRRAPTYYTTGSAPRVNNITWHTWQLPTCMAHCHLFQINYLFATIYVPRCISYLYYILWFPFIHDWVIKAPTVSVWLGTEQSSQHLMEMKFKAFPDISLRKFQNSIRNIFTLMRLLGSQAVVQVKHSQFSVSGELSRKFCGFSLTGKMETHFQGLPWFPVWLAPLPLYDEWQWIFSIFSTL